MTAATHTPEKPTRIEYHASLHDVWKAFGERSVLEGASLDLRPGEITVVIGGSGCGKSTLLRILLGLESYERGSVRLFGREVSALSRSEQSELMMRVGMLFQFGALFDSMTVGENVGFALRYVQRRPEDEIAQRVRENLALVGLRDVEALYPAQLSGGMRKRVGLARAIAIQPEVILYDEPTTGLDPVNVRRINGLIMSLQKKLGVTSIVVTHDMDSCFTVSDRIAMLYERRIAFTGTAEETQTCDIRYVREFIAGGRGTLDEDVV